MTTPNDPELLECCVKALAAWEGTGPAIVLDELRAAIAKATGAAAPPRQRTCEGHDMVLKLPPLPEPAYTSYQTGPTMRSVELRSFSATQMREYARAACAAGPALTDEQIQKLEFQRWVREIATGPTPTAGTDEAPRRRNDDNWQDYDQHPAAPKPHGPVSEQFMRHHYGAKK
jgi:hypothetical protein